MTDKELIKLYEQQLETANERILKEMKNGTWAIDRLSEQVQVNGELSDAIKYLEAIIFKLMEKHGYETLPDDVLPEIVTDSEPEPDNSSHSV